MGVHPDRHATGPAREVATQKFAEMKRVYDILMDPTQRQIYDAYGEKGVESGLNVGSLLKTPAEVRAEFLKQHYASQLQVQRRRRTPPRRYFCVAVDILLSAHSP
jgi:DnaJ family protein C protein 11